MKTEKSVESTQKLGAPDDPVGFDQNLDLKSLYGPDTCLLPVDEESMVDAGIVPGDILVVKTAYVFKQKEIYVVTIDGRKTMVRFVMWTRSDCWLLEADYGTPAILYRSERVNFCGMVVGILRSSDRARQIQNS